MSELEELRGKNSKYEQSNLFIDQSIQRLEEVKGEYHAQEERIGFLEEIEREKAKLSSFMRQGEVLHAQGLKHKQKTICLGDFPSFMRGKVADLTSQLKQIDASRQECLGF